MNAAAVLLGIIIVGGLMFLAKPVKAAPPPPPNGWPWKSKAVPEPSYPAILEYEGTRGERVWLQRVSRIGDTISVMLSVTYQNVGTSVSTGYSIGTPEQVALLRQHYATLVEIANRNTNASTLADLHAAAHVLAQL